jgi:hypothetical protein
VLVQCTRALLDKLNNLYNNIQAVFDWQDYHLHDFAVIADEKAEMWIIMDDGGSIR